MVGDLAFVFKKNSLRRVPAKRGEKRNWSSGPALFVPPIYAQVNLAYSVKTKKTQGFTLVYFHSYSEREFASQSPGQTW